MTLRHFNVLLVAWASRRDHPRAHRVFEMITERGLTPTEEEYGLLVEACIGTAPLPVVAAILRRMAAEFEGVVPEPTVAALEAYFTAAGHTVRRVAVNPDDGSVPGAGLTVRLEVLSPEGLADIRTVVERIAIESGANLTPFREWLYGQQRFSAIIDGSNVAFFGHSRSLLFCPEQIQEMYLRLQGEGFERPLVVLHRSRVGRHWPRAQQFLRHLIQEESLYVVEEGYDDLFWVYAALYHDAPYVSNDELCDVLFKLREVPAFDRWSRQHRLQYDFDPRGRALLKPPPRFTVCVQEFPGPRWMVPTADDAKSWLLIEAVGGDPPPPGPVPPP